MYRLIQSLNLQSKPENLEETIVKLRGLFQNAVVPDKNLVMDCLSLRINSQWNPLLLTKNLRFNTKQRNKKKRFCKNSMKNLAIH